MTKYLTLLNVLDQIRKEAPREYLSYYPPETKQEEFDYARSKAFIHLFLKVRFGLLDFVERETYLVDGPNDGGVDAYYIDRDNRNIYYIQSKFRTNQINFEQKNIDIKDILKMDVDRISEGETKDIQGIDYNTKIQKIIRKIQSIEDVGRYDHKIILIANLKQTDREKLRRLVGEFPTEIIDFSRCYDELLFPVISGNYYHAADLIINIQLSKKEQSVMLDYSVDTEFSECEIKVLFVPTIEIAKILHKYKNSILKHNPRSYLTLSQNKVNKDIAKSIQENDTNEFALFNNGITMLSDSTSFSTKTGRPFSAQLIL